MRFQKKMRPVSLEIPEPGETRYQKLMRQDPKLTRSRATRCTLRPKCPQSHKPKKSKQRSAFVEFTESPVFRLVRCRNKKCQFLDHMRLARSTRNGPPPFLSWLKNDKVIGVADEHTPEEIRGQQSIELGRAGILPGVCEGEEGYAGECE